MSTSTERLLAALVPVVPGLADAAARDREWLASEAGLPPLDPAAWTVAEAARDLFARLRDGDAAAAGVIVAMGDVLEEWLGTDVDVDGVIEDVLVHYPSPGEEHDDVTHALGPGLRAALDAQRDVRQPAAVEAFVAGLVAAVPALRQLADDNRYGYHDVVLAHPFLGEVVQREVELLTGDASPEAGPVPDDPVAEVRSVLDHVEATLGSDPAVDELVRVSFVENLPYPGEPGEEIVTMLGPRLAAALSDLRGLGA